MKKTVSRTILTLGHRVKIIVRSKNNIPGSWGSEERITIIKSDITTDGLAI